MSRPMLGVLVTTVALAATVLLLGGIVSESWRGLCVMAVLFGAWVASMLLGGSTAPRNRLGLVAVAGLSALLAANQIESWIADCGGRMTTTNPVSDDAE
jgi:hypothetical protein